MGKIYIFFLFFYLTNWVIFHLNQQHLYMKLNFHYKTNMSCIFWLNEPHSFLCKMQINTPVTACSKVNELYYLVEELYILIIININNAKSYWTLLQFITLLFMTLILLVTLVCFFQKHKKMYWAQTFERRCMLLLPPFIKECWKFTFGFAGLSLNWEVNLSARSWMLGMCKGTWSS